MKSNRITREIQKALIATLGILVLCLAFLCSYLFAPVWLLAAMGISVIVFIGAITVAVSRAICNHSKN